MSTRRLVLALALAATGIIVAGALVGAPSASSAPGTPPIASFTATPNPAQVDETVTFDGSASTDDGAGSTVATFEWDLDGDGAFETNTGTTPTTSRSYSDPGTITVRLRVTDSEGDVAEKSRELRVNTPPFSGFISEPSNPEVNEQIAFSSTSADAEGPIPSASHRWDFDADGEFDDATGETVTHSFSSPGTMRVRLEVTDSDGAKAIGARNVVVETPALDLLSPFPVVRIIGELRQSGNTAVERLSIRGPRGSDVVLRCHGNSCPFSDRERVVGRKRVTFPGLEQPLHPDVVIEVFVTESDKIGKFTRFKLRKLKAPKRQDKCVERETLEPIPCPRA